MSGGGFTRFTDAEVIFMRRLRARGASYPEIAQAFGVGVPTVRKIIIGHAYKHLNESEGIAA